jgi:D-sedoheptulose 7-phosphate isomerase
MCGETIGLITDFKSHWRGRGSMERALEKIITTGLKEAVSVKEDFIEKNASKLTQLAEHVSDAFRNGRKLLICGNGGSAADAQHLAAEFVNRFLLERPPLPALALSTDTSIITSVANDYTYEEVFSKQIRALGVAGDILLAISTSGRSGNLLSAVWAARERGIYTVGFLGGDGGEMLGLVDLALVVESRHTARVQEVHILAEHLLCEMVEHILFQRNHSV